jgi:hypothetical protein
MKRAGHGYARAPADYLGLVRRDDPILFPLNNQPRFAYHSFVRRQLVPGRTPNLKE